MRLKTVESRSDKGYSIQDILGHFKTFPVSSRDQLLRLFCGGDRRKITKLNEKLRKLVDRGQLDVNKEILPYVYFGVPRRIQKRTNTLNHHMAIVDFWIWLLEGSRAYNCPDPVVVSYEHNFGRGKAKPDIILEWEGKTWFVEVQRSVISQKKMDKKMKMYEEVYVDGAYEKEFTVWVVTNKPYQLNTDIPTKQTVVDFL